MESIFRHGPPTVREVQEAEPQASDSGGAPALPDVSEAHTKIARSKRGYSGRRKPYLAIPESNRGDADQSASEEATPYLTGAELKAFVATIPDDTVIYYIDVGERRWPVVKEVPAGIVIEGKK